MTFELHLTVSLTDPTPPYEQVRRQVAAHIRGGRLEPGARLPTVRQLAADLGLAAGTVARAYKELEDARLITTHRARGTHVTQNAAPSLPPEVRAAAASLAAAAHRHGLDLEAAIETVRTAW